MHGAIGLLAIIGLIGFAFGERAAIVTVRVGFVVAALAIAYVIVRVVSGTI